MAPGEQSGVGSELRQKAERVLDALRAFVFEWCWNLQFPLLS
jgi:hypothetical protein